MIQLKYIHIKIINVYYDHKKENVILLLTVLLILFISTIFPRFIGKNIILKPT